MTGPRVEVDCYVVYPSNYDRIPFSDRSTWCLIVQNGHAYGWSVRPGPPGAGSPRAMNRKGKWVWETRGDGRNKARRFPLEEALEIAKTYVDVHTVNGLSAILAEAHDLSRNMQ